MEMYYASVEVDDRTPITRTTDVDGWMALLEQYHGSPGMSVRGFRSAGVFLPAESLAQAATTAAAVVSSLYGAAAVACEVMTEKEFNAREGFEDLPELVSVTEAGELLGVSRQAVLDRIRRGTLQATKVGESYAIPRAQLGARA